MSTFLLGLLILIGGISLPIFTVGCILIGMKFYLFGGFVIFVSLIKRVRIVKTEPKRETNGNVN